MKYLYVLLVIAFLSCKNEKNSTDTNNNTPVKEETTQTSTSTAKKTAIFNPEYPGITVDEMKVLFSKCDAVDYVFDNLPFSINMTEKGAIQNNLAAIANEPCACDYKKSNHLGREHLMIQGDIVWIVDIYLDQNCGCYTFTKDNTVMYANAITAKGKSFYTNLINQALEQRKKLAK